MMDCKMFVLQPIKCVSCNALSVSCLICTVDLCASVKKLLNTRMIVWRENCDKITDFIECFDGV